MPSSALTSEWIRRERFRHDMVVLGVVLVCLAVAFFPRNERRLFTFPGEGGLMATMSAPLPTSLRSRIFDGPGRVGPGTGAPGFVAPPPANGLGGGREESVLPAALPDFSFGTPRDDWRDQITDQPLRFTPVPALLTPPTLNSPPSPPPGFIPPPPFVPVEVVPDKPVIPGAVPEPATWAMMIGGIGIVAWQMRAIRLQRLKQRGRRRWRRKLVPGA